MLQTHAYLLADACYVFAFNDKNITIPVQKMQFIQVLHTVLE